MWERQQLLPGGEAMTRVLEAVVDERGVLRLLEPVEPGPRRRALVSILDDLPRPISESALLSEAALAEDWNRPEEDEAWSHLQPAQ